MSSDHSQNLSLSSSINDFSGVRRSSRRRSRNASSDDEDFVADEKELEKIEAKNPNASDHITPRSTSASQLINYVDPSSSGDEDGEEFEYGYEEDLETNQNFQGENNNNQHRHKHKRELENEISLFEQTNKIEHIFLSRESDQGIEYLVTFQNSESPFAQWILAVILGDFDNFLRMLKKFNETEMKMSFYNTMTHIFEVSYNSPLHIISHRFFSENKLEFLFQFDLETGTAFFWEIGGQPATENLIKHYLETLVCIIGQPISTPDLQIPEAKNNNDGNNNSNNLNNSLFYNNNNDFLYNSNTMINTNNNYLYNRVLMKRPKELKIEYSESDEYKSVDDKTPRDYQIDGVNWMLSCFCQGHGCILADEMGLGKTIQSLVFLMKLNKDTEFHGPHLIAVRTNTYNQWCSEIERWCNMKIKYIAYQGDPQTRDLIREYQFPSIDEKGNRVPNSYGFNILLATYDIVLKDSDVLKDVDWQVIIIDEGHRIKNNVGKKHHAFQSFKYQHRIILTGTPIQNTLQELFTLLNFVSPEYFQDESIFPEDDIESLDESVLKNLFLKISPHLMRRSLLSVEHSIIPKEERVAFLHMTLEQMELTRLNKLHALDRISQSFDTLSESSCNQRICNHPFLINGAEKFYTKKYSKLSRLDLLIQTSSKFMFLDKILPIIQKSNRSVLLFSQRLKTLRLLQEYCKLKKYNSVMLIGEMNENEKKDAINQFSDPNSDVFIFLISTRSGSEGLNLTKASFSIIFDPDWNPQNDLQAQARCHRIGQTQKVDVLRLITYGSYEHEMFSRAQRKLSLWLSLFGDGSQIKQNQHDSLSDQISIQNNKYDSIMSPLKRNDSTTEFESELPYDVKADSNLNSSTNNDSNSNSVKSIESTVKEPPFIKKFDKHKVYTNIDDVLEDMATVVTEERMPIVSQEAIPIQDLSMNMADDQFLKKFPLPPSITSSPSASKSNGTSVNKKGRPVMQKINFDPKAAKQVILQLERVGYGEWEKIYEIVDENICNIPQLAKFCQMAILLHFRACDPSRVSSFPLLINRLLSDRPDLEFTNFFCKDPANEWYFRGEASVCKYIRGHIFKTCFNFLSILEFHLIISEYIQMKKELAKINSNKSQIINLNPNENESLNQTENENISLNSDQTENENINLNLDQKENENLSLNLDENENESEKLNSENNESDFEINFPFDELPPYPDFMSKDKGIFDRLVRLNEFSSVNSRVFQILSLMKYEMIKNFSLIEKKVYNFQFWTKYEISSIMSMMRNYGNMITMDDIHPKSGLLSKTPAQVRMIALALMRFFSPERTINSPVIIPTTLTNNAKYGPIPSLKENLIIDATDASILYKRICIFSLMNKALINITLKLSLKQQQQKTNDDEEQQKNEEDDVFLPDGKGWWTLEHCKILFENMLRFGLDNLSNILLSPDLCFRKNLTDRDIERLTTGIYRNAPVFNLHDKEEESKIPPFLINDSSFFSFLRQLCGLNDTQYNKNSNENKAENRSQGDSSSATTTNHASSSAKNTRERVKKKKIRKQKIQFFIPKVKNFQFHFNSKTRFGSDIED